eukprot:355066-Chlamydomonas_euryale.AAC.15
MLDPCDDLDDDGKDLASGQPSETEDEGYEHDMQGVTGEQPNQGTRFDSSHFMPLTMSKLWLARRLQMKTRIPLYCDTSHKITEGLRPSTDSNHEIHSRFVVMLTWAAVDRLLAAIKCFGSWGQWGNRRAQSSKIASRR